MDFDEIKQILEMMREHELSEFELERDNFKLRVRKNTAGHWAPAAPAAVPHSVVCSAGDAAAGHAAGAPVAPLPAANVLTAADEEMELAVVKSPIVGTFYRASDPGAKPFAEVGERVRKGQVLCIIEAMKLMNEINAEIDGEVVKVYVENGQAVQYRRAAPRDQTCLAAMFTATNHRGTEAQSPLWSLVFGLQTPVFPGNQPVAAVDFRRRTKGSSHLISVSLCLCGSSSVKDVRCSRRS